ncbi:hypothetical protein ACQ4PT_034936 [Festuca glaucescens]
MAPESAIAHIFPAVCFLFLPIFLSHHVAAATTPLSFSFDFANTSKYRLDDLRFEGDAALNRDLVDLTCNPIAYYCSGRMSYNHPVPFYDNSTGEVASFTTTFTFAMNMLPNTTKNGDGMSFFLSGYPSRLPPESCSSVLGLTNSSTNISTGADRFLAVEFDTYGNAWDPTGSTDHMGIDHNSISSVSITRLPSYSLNGTMTATITFDNTSRTLEATLHFDYKNSLATASVKTQLSDQLHALLPPEACQTALLKNLVVALEISDRLKRIQNSFGKDSRLKRYEYSDLYMATDKFSEKKEIGKGGFGVVYSGSLKKKDVAVKKILKDSRGEFKDFLAELGAIDGTGHVNLVRLEGWCCSINNYMFWCFGRQHVELFLVYELVPNGTLHQHLYENPEVLSWEMRVAEHNNVTSVQTEAAAGTMRYMDPQSMTDGQANLRRSSDYSFGIVLLEIAHGKYNPGLVRHMHKNRPYTFVEDVADEKLAGQFDRVQMERVIVLGLRCSEEVASKRPSLDAAAMQFLESGGELHAATIHKDEPRPTTAHA